MSMIKKLVEYSVKEIEMAENYARFACYVDDPTVAQKFNEIAKDEIKHYEYFKSILKKEEIEMEKIEPKEDVHKKFMDSYIEMVEDWKDKIVYKINSYQIKR